jgi:hypothetical protein
MAKRIILKETDLSLGSNPPAGYKYLGFDDDILSERTGATVSEISSYKYIEVLITSSQITNMGTTSIVLLPAPGSNKYYDYKITLEFSISTVDYSPAGLLYVAGNRSNDYTPILGNPALWSNTEKRVTHISSTPLNSYDDSEFTNFSGFQTENESIIMGWWNGLNQTQGDGTILAKIWYRIRNFG